MPSIRLKEGDFGSDADIMIGMSSLYLPDQSRDGMTIPVSFTDIAAIESLSDDRSEQLKQAVTLSLKGLAAAGPAGLLNGVRAVTAGKTVLFQVRLRDERTFIAAADAGTLAHLRDEVSAARTTVDTSAADAVIAKYLASEGPQPPASRAQPAPPAPPGEEAAEIAALPADGTDRPVFGRRRPAP